MVALNRELADILFLFTTNIQNNSITLSTTVPMDIEVDMSRGKSFVTSSNNSRESSTHSNMLFIVYADRIQALANIPT